MTANPPVVTSTDRLTFTVFLAAAVHAALVLGISFSLGDLGQIPHTLEVTLARTVSKEAPDEADFLAQANQIGSGTLEEKAELSTTEQADFQDSKINEVAQEQQLASTTLQQQLEQTVITTTSQSSTQTLFIDQLEQREQEDISRNHGKTLLQRSLEIASLEAELKDQRQAYAKRPRIHRITATSTKSSEDAFYMHNWVRRVEKIGNNYYPTEANRRNIFGKLRMSVIMRPDGSVKTMKILTSSGHRLLDDAARRIVRRAAPFQPFPENLQKTSDLIEIIRTWNFEQNSYFSSS